MINHKNAFTGLRIRTLILLCPVIVAGCGSAYMAPGSNTPPPGGNTAPSSMSGNWSLFFIPWTRLIIILHWRQT
jgi:hypothetical protein